MDWSKVHSFQSQRKLFLLNWNRWKFYKKFELWENATIQYYWWFCLLVDWSLDIWMCNRWSGQCVPLLSLDFFDLTLLQQHLRFTHVFRSFFSAVLFVVVFFWHSIFFFCSLMRFFAYMFLWKLRANLYFYQRPGLRRHSEQSSRITHDF